LDAFVGNAFTQANTVWLNDGTGGFSDSSQRLGSYSSRGVALGDLDSDGDLDAFVANELNQTNKVWLNDGAGFFSDSGQGLGGSQSHGVGLGDVDSDRDLDAFVPNSFGQGDRVWLNDGTGVFTDSGQSLDSSDGKEVALGDLNDDGSLDAFVGNNGANRVWLNQPGTPPDSVGINGEMTGLVQTANVFTATISPATAALPMTYVWQATGQAPIVHTGGLTDTAIFTWSMAGTQAVSVTATSIAGSVTATHFITLTEIPEAELWAVEYRWGDPAPGYRYVMEQSLFVGWMEVRIENRGAEDAFNVTATVSDWPENTWVPPSDRSVEVGDIPAGASEWSTDTFVTVVDMEHPVDPCEGIFWQIEYDDADGVHHVIEGLPEFPPGEGPCD